MPVCDDCGDVFFENETPSIADDLDQIADLIAQAAITSRHAANAYVLLRSTYPELQDLTARRSLIAGRMGEAA